MNLTPLTEALSLLTLDPPVAGFENFIGVWLYRGAQSFIVDVGPSVSAAEVIQTVKAETAGSLDFILLTHIHLDHAGGIGHVAEAFAGAPVVCHAAGLPHLVDPQRLWEGTLRTLGATGRAYGPIKPVDPRRLVAADQFDAAGLEAVITPGHASHHASYLYGDCLFAGEAAGVSLRLPSGQDYVRPATPPRFYLDAALASIEVLESRRPRRIAYGHFGLWDDAAGRLQSHRDQLQHWEAVIRSEIASGADESLRERCLERLLREDPWLAGLAEMSAAVRAREQSFLRNSLKGFLGWIETGGSVE